MKLKFPDLTNVLACVNGNCPASKEGILPEEAHARLRQDGEDVVAEPICLACAGDAAKRGISAPLISSLIKREEEARAIIVANAKEVESHDARQRELDALFAGAVFFCRVPGCSAAPEPVNKMFSAVYIEGGKEQVVPICPICVDGAHQTGVKVTDLHATIARLTREGREHLLYEQAERNKVPANNFLAACQRGDARNQRAMPAVVAHHGNGNGNGLGNRPRLATNR
ncbi:MAG: hypothetical protein Q7R69_01465 [bacterium]|nr:hypothetical protein [bacterium]